MLLSRSLPSHYETHVFNKCGGRYQSLLPVVPPVNLAYWQIGNWADRMMKLVTQMSTVYRRISKTQPTMSKHWMKVVSHPDRPQSNQAHLTMSIIQHACTYDTRQWKHKQINLTHISKAKHSDWTQWHEAKSGRPNLWAGQMIVQLVYYH